MHKEKRIFDFTLNLLLATIGILLVTRGLSLEESLTYYVIKGDLSELSKRAISMQGQSPFFFVIVYFVSKVMGHSEFALRLPSIIAFLISILIYSKVLNLLKFQKINIAVYSYVAASILSADGILLQARPYSIALMLFLISIYSLLEYYSNTKKPYWLLAHAVTLSLSIYTVYLFALSTPIILYILCRYKFQNFKKYILISIFTFPIYLISLDHIHIIINKKSAWSYLTHINIIDVLLPFWLIIPAVACMIIILRDDKSKFEFRNNPNLKFALLWLYLPNIMALIIQEIFGVSVASQKYLIWGVPGVGMLTNVFWPNIEKQTYARLAKSLILIVALAQGFHSFESEIWQKSRIIKQLNSETTLCVVVYSGLVESYGNDLYTSEVLSEYLVSPVRYYLPNAKLYPLPLSGWSNEWYERIFKVAVKECGSSIYAIFGNAPCVVDGEDRNINIVQTFKDNIGSAATCDTETLLQNNNKALLKLECA